MSAAIRLIVIECRRFAMAATNVLESRDPTTRWRSLGMLTVWLLVPLAGAAAAAVLAGAIAIPSMARVPLHFCAVGASFLALLIAIDSFRRGFVPLSDVFRTHRERWMLTIGVPIGAVAFRRTVASVVRLAAIGLLPTLVMSFSASAMTSGWRQADGIGIVIVVGLMAEALGHMAVRSSGRSYLVYRAVGVAALVGWWFSLLLGIGETFIAFPPVLRAISWLGTALWLAVAQQAWLLRLVILGIVFAGACHVVTRELLLQILPGDRSMFSPVWRRPERPRSVPAGLDSVSARHGVFLTILQSELQLWRVWVRRETIPLVVVAIMSLAPVLVLALRDGGSAAAVPATKVRWLMLYALAWVGLVVSEVPWTLERPRMWEHFRVIGISPLQPLLARAAISVLFIMTWGGVLTMTLGIRDSSGASAVAGGLVLGIAALIAAAVLLGGAASTRVYHTQSLLRRLVRYTAVLAALFSAGLAFANLSAANAVSVAWTVAAVSLSLSYRLMSTQQFLSSASRDA